MMWKLHFNHYHLSNIFKGAHQVRFLRLIPQVAVQAIKSNLGKPKGALNGYSLFYQEKYTEIKRQFPNFSIVDIGKRAGAAWNALNAIDKKRYIDRAQQLSQQTRADMADYQKNLTERQKLARRALFYHNQYSRGQIMRSEIPSDIKKFIKGLPSSPFQTGRHMFLSSKLRGQKNAINMMGDTSMEWDRLSVSEKKAYDDRAGADMRNFVKLMASYLSKE